MVKESFVQAAKFMRIYYGTIKPFVECANAIHHLSYVRETAHQGGISSVT